jgi:hypothetical protein
VAEPDAGAGGVLVVFGVLVSMFGGLRRRD